MWHCYILTQHRNIGLTASHNSTNKYTNALAHSARTFSRWRCRECRNIWQITIVSAKAGGTQSYLKPGHTYLTIVVAAKNISSQEQDISSFYFTLRDPSGESQDVTYDPDAPVSMLSGKVEPGSPIKGGLTFSVSTSEHQFQLFFEVSVIASGQTIWDIHV